MKKPAPIDLRPYAGMLGDAREFLRVWATASGPTTCFINPVPIGADPMALGLALVDVVRHGARAYAQATGIPEAEAEARIWKGLDAERADPTDPGMQIAPDDDGGDPGDDFISYVPKKDID